MLKAWALWDGAGSRFMRKPVHQTAGGSQSPFRGVPTALQVPGAPIDGMFLNPVVYQNRYEQTQRDTTERQIRMGRNRKSPSRAAGVQAAVALYGKTTVVRKPVPPVMPVEADTQPFTTQWTSDIRFGVGIIVRTE